MQILLLDEPRWTGWWMSCVDEPMASGIDSPLHSVVRPYPSSKNNNKSLLFNFNLFLKMSNG
ncbi:hypothetical protein T05_11148 [Trichinella murrelli]|uniref:Uncharacterized protein n=1 Tax=Trichinella murrelli TaxID=144512 RepID=A0A0V0TVY9_9BILA|nr:hypothetical protein T05_11148 [Trichinella murrelli]